MMAIGVFQVVAGQIRVLDFYIDLLNERGWTDRIDWLPHDAAVHELGTGKTRVEMLDALGCKIARVPNLRRGQHQRHEA